MSKLSVVIGRFQPLHNEHVKMIEHAISLGERTKVFIGSAFEPRSLKNPWTWNERKDMLKAVFGDRIEIGALRDFPYNDDCWFENAKENINATLDYGVDLKQITIVGCAKDGDDSTWYLNHFPEYNVEFFQPKAQLNATDIRKGLFSENGFKKDDVPAPVYDYIMNWTTETNRDDYSNLVLQLVDVNKYHKQWGKGPFTCVDAIIEAENKFAIIRHIEGTFALPGGFLDYGERTLAGARRECREEIGFDPGKRPVGVFVADNPDRDPRCHNVSIVYKWKLPEIVELTAGDDALDVFWMTWEEIVMYRANFRADHAHLIEEMFHV